MEVKRKHIRFGTDDPMSIALIDLDEGSDTFKPKLTALPVSESYGGCGLVLRHTDQIKEGIYLKIKIGEMNPMSARTAWCRPLEANLLMIGIEFLE